MKFMRPPLTAIFFYDLFLQVGGMPPWPPGSATGKQRTKSDSRIILLNSIKTYQFLLTNTRCLKEIHFDRIVCTE